MLTFTPKVLSLILIGIYILSFYFQTRFKGLIGVAFVCFLLAALKLFMPDKLMLVVLIAIVSFAITFALSFKEIKSLERSGQGIIVFSNKNTVLAIFLFFIYVLARIFYFDKG